MATSTSARNSPSRGRLPRSLNWREFVQDVRRRPVLSAGVLALAAVLLGAISYFVIYPQSVAMYHWWQAEKRIKAYEFRAAREHLKECLKVWPSSGEAHFLLARCSRRDGDLPAAREHLQQAKECGWPTAPVDLEYKLIQAQSGSVRPVESVLQEYASTQHQDQMLILEALVIGYLQNNYLEDAYHWVTVWIKHHPGMWQPRLLRGDCLERGQRPYLAAQEYLAVLELKPDQPDARLKLANILLTSRQFPEALPHFLKYLELRPDDPDGLTGLARCQRALQQPEQALATLDRIATDRPQPAEAFLVRGLLLLDEDKPQEALPWLQKAHGRWPGALDTNHAMSRVLRELGRDADAIPYDERRLQIERAAKRMENLMKDLLTTVQRDSTGRPIRDDAAIAKSVALRYEAGTLMLEIGDENEAAAWFLSAVQEDPNHADSRRALADFHRRQNERKGGPTVAPTGARSPFGSGAPSGEPKP